MNIVIAIIILFRYCNIFMLLMMSTFLTMNTVCFNISHTQFVTLYDIYNGIDVDVFDDIDVSGIHKYFIRNFHIPASLC